MKFFTLVEDNKPVTTINPANICLLDWKNRTIRMADGFVIHCSQGPFDSIIKHLNEVGLFV